MGNFISPAILGQTVSDQVTSVVVKIISQEKPSIKIVPMPGTKGDKGDTGTPGAQGPQGPQGIPGNAGTDFADVTFTSGLSYNSITKTLSITNIDGGEI